VLQRLPIMCGCLMRALMIRSVRSYAVRCKIETEFELI
jgi:hypothetical protein